MSKSLEVLNFTWTEWKVMKQYRSMGDMLDRCKIYGFSGAVESFLEENISRAGENDHNWLTADPPVEEP